MQGSDPINFSPLEKSTDFLTLKVQAKFFAGRVAYTKEEAEILKTWIQENDSNKMYAFFVETVLKGGEFSHKSFINSDLYRIFDEFHVL